MPAAQIVNYFLCLLFNQNFSFVTPLDDSYPLILVFGIGFSLLHSNHDLISIGFKVLNIHLLRFN